MDNISKVLSKIRPTDKVLDIGGWAKPFNRANYVLDYMPYKTRGMASKRGKFGPDKEYFSKETWIVFDICSRKPFPFKDKEFDFIFCSHTLEDISDPIWVCSEINRIGKGGYIETPSRIIESHKNIGGKWNLNRYVAGYSHHRWYVENFGNKLLFTFKNPLIHAIKEFQVNNVNEPKIMSFFWEDNFEYEENKINAESYKSIFADLKRFKLSTVPVKQRDKIERKLDCLIRNLQQIPFKKKVITKLKLLVK
ncbi:MAG: methyltransferase domain-containing protein [bacterium]